MNDQELMVETKNLEGLTVAKKWMNEKKIALKRIGRTFDTQLPDDDNEAFEISTSSI